MITYNTFIFDLDGTLLDTLSDLAASTNYALRSCGMPEHSVEDVRRFVGNGVRLLMERAVPDGAANPRFDEAFATFRQHYMAHSLDTTRPYDGIPEMLTTLKAKGCRMAVVSNKFYAATQELCRHFFADTIDVAIGEHEVRVSVRNQPPIPSSRPFASLGWGRKAPYMWGIAMWISRRPGIVVCLVSASSGASAIATSYKKMEQRPLFPPRQSCFWKLLIKLLNKYLVD